MNDSRKKKALLLCAGHNDLGLVRSLRKLGYYIIATGNNPTAPGNKWVDKWICEDYSDKEKILDIAEKEKIDAVCQCCNDFGVYTASYIAEKMGLPGYDSYETAVILHNKDRFKEFAAQNGILSLQGGIFSEEKEAIGSVHPEKLPIIAKPVDASAGNGIGVIRTLKESERVIKKAFQVSREKKIVLEPYLEGEQSGFCTFLHNKKVVAIASNNEYSFINPFRVEIDTFPSKSYDTCRDFLVNEIEQIADKLDLADGIFHLQYIMYDGKPWIIEVMRRVLGNMYSVPANQVTGLDWDYWETRAKCGLSCRDFPQNVRHEGCFAYKSVMAEQNGVIEGINVPSEYKKHIFYEYWLKRTGDIIIDNMKEPVGFLFMMFSDVQEMDEVLINNYRSDIISIKPQE